MNMRSDNHVGRLGSHQSNFATRYLHENVGRCDQDPELTFPSAVAPQPVINQIPCSIADGSGLAYPHTRNIDEKIQKKHVQASL